MNRLTFTKPETLIESAIVAAIVPIFFFVLLSRYGEGSELGWFPIYGGCITIFLYLVGWPVLCAGYVSSLNSRGKGSDSRLRGFRWALWFVWLVYLFAGLIVVGLMLDPFRQGLVG